MLPITKALPKEMLPIGKAPLIQFAIEEIAASGIREIVLIVAPGKDTIQKYFERDTDLENVLEQRGRHKDSQLIRSLSQGAEIRVVYQDQPLGLGHAITCARQAIGNEPFALLLPDAFIASERPCIRQLIDCYETTPGSYIATREVEPEDFSRFGILEVSVADNCPSNSRCLRVNGLVEKPTPEVAPSRYGVFGRYLLEPAIFDYIDSIRPLPGQEIQLTEALGRFCHDFPMYAVRFDGDHFDVGNELGLLEASVRMGLRSADVGEEFRRYLLSILAVQDDSLTV
jgi:UTP--glucose-1-phosphate uridylyltransferase